MLYAVLLLVLRQLFILGLLLALSVSVNNRMPSFVRSGHIHKHYEWKEPEMKVILKMHFVLDTTLKGEKSILA